MHANVEASSDTRRANINIAAIANAIIIAKKRANDKVAATASKPTKKRVDTKVVALANKTATSNAIKPASNTRRVHANVMATADANRTAATNKSISNTKNVHANVTASSNGHNIKRANINKAATVDKSNTRSVCQYSGYYRYQCNGQ